MKECKERLTRRIREIYEAEKDILSKPDGAERMASALLKSGVLFPPYRIGQPIYSYIIDPVEGSAYIVQDHIADISTKGIWIPEYVDGHCDDSDNYFEAYEAVGEYIFLSRGEAEQALCEALRKEKGEGVWTKRNGSWWRTTTT